MTEPTTDSLIAALAAIPEQLEALRQQRTGGEVAAAGPDTWTPSEIVGHLCDAARYWGARIRRVAREDDPALESFDENLLVRLAAHSYWPLDTLLREFRLLSDDNVALLRGLPPAAWERAGVHETRGRLTLREVVTIEAAHEQAHVGQFAEALGE
ncbi:MAG: DinB family protein [Ktedonobacterales bacterium]